MAGEWLTMKFGDLLIDGTRNGIYKQKEFHGSGTKIVNMGELFAYPRLYDVPMKRLELTESELNRSTLEVSDLLFARRSLVAEGAGKCSIVMEVNEPTAFESSIIRARPNPDIANGLFLFYLFNSPHGRYLLGTILRQVAVSGITGNDLVQLEVPLPPLPEQRAIAHILGTLDDKIEINRRMNETLEGMARAIFKSWFVDFDPVHAKMRGEQPAGLAPEIAALFPDALVDTELGEAPEGWEVIGLNETATFLNGLALQKYPPENGESLPVIKIAQLRKGNTEGADKASAEIAEAYVVEDGDVLFSWSGSLECVLWTGGRGALNQHLFKVASDRFPKWFYYLWIHQHLSWFQTIAAGKATTMGHIQRHHLAEAKVSVPPPTILSACGSSSWANAGCPGFTST
jgi:type I restriction enzyme, S subunit